MSPGDCGAVRTPEVFVLDAERVVRYWGRVDDQHGHPTFAADLAVTLRRLGEPLDIARAALLLASDEADFITGHGLVADAPGDAVDLLLGVGQRSRSHALARVFIRNLVKRGPVGHVEVG